MWEWLTGAAAGMGEAVSNGIAYLVSQLCAWVLVLGATLLSWAPDISGQVDSATGQSVMAVVLSFDAFVPVRETAALYFAALVFRVSWPLIWRALSLIPGVG